MLQRLIAFSLRQRLMVLLAVLVLAGFGLRAYLQLPIDAFPDISPTQVKIILKAPGMTPEEVESRVVAPIELELLGIPDADDAALDREVRDRRHHHRLRGRHRHLLGAPAGGGAPAATSSTRPAGRRRRRAGADHHAAVATCSCSPSRAAACACRKSAPCSTGRSARRCARCPAWPTSTRWAAACAPSRWCPTAPRWPARGVHAGRPAAGAGAQQPQRRRRPPAATAKKRCWCASKARSRTLDDLRHIVVRQAAAAAGARSATWRACASAR